MVGLSFMLTRDALIGLFYIFMDWSYAPGVNPATKETNKSSPIGATQLQSSFMFQALDKRL